MLSGIPLFPAQASTLAPEVDNLYFFILAVTAFFALLVVIFVIDLRGQVPRRHRREGRARRSTGRFRSSSAGRSSPSSSRWGSSSTRPSSSSSWCGRRPRRSRSTPPASAGCGASSTSTARAKSTSCTCPGRPVKVTFTSEDVLHSLYYPGVPRQGRRDSRAATARSGSSRRRRATFHLFCAEYCGTQHSGMIGQVVVMEPDDYQAWLSGSDGQPLAVRGQQLFQQLACVTCHLDDGTGRGPSLAGVYGTKVELANGAAVVVDDDGYIRESILTPQMKLVAGYQPLMPTFQGLVNEEGVMGLIEYIKSLPRCRQPPCAAQASAAPAARAAQGKAPMTTTALPRVTYLNHESRRRVVAADEGPQAHRPAVPGGRHARVHAGRPLRRRHPDRADDAGRATCGRPTPTTSCSRCTASRWCSSC